MLRDLDIRISTPSEAGYIVHEGALPLAAFSTAADLCLWLEDKLRPLDPPVHAGEPMPSAAKIGDWAEPKSRRGFVANLVGKV